MSKGKGNQKQDDLMDDAIGNMTTLLQMSQGCTMDEAYEQTVRQISDVLNLRPARSADFNEGDTIRARGMGVIL